MNETTTQTPAYADTRWPWQLKIVYDDGTVRTEDYSADPGTDALGLARHLSTSRPGVARVELATVFVAGQQVSPGAVADHETPEGER